MQTSTDHCAQPSSLLIRDVDDEEESISAPPFSPLSGISAFTDSNSEKSVIGSGEEDLYKELDQEQNLLESPPDAGDQLKNLSRDTDQSIQITHSTATSPSPFLEKWEGYKLMGDNIDKNFQASYQIIDRSTQSFHYFHVYAVLDRVDFSGLSDVVPGASTVYPSSLVPSDADLSRVKQDMSILISR